MIPLENAGFTLDIGGVAGFFGGDEVLSAMGTIHLYKGRKYLGWYNSPGSYTVAKKYGRLADSRFWKGLFPRDNVDINKFLGFDGEKGPAFLGAHSGTRMSHTSYIAYLLSSECEQNAETVLENGTDEALPTCSVSVARLSRRPPPDTLISTRKTWMAVIPILASVGSAATCAYFHDWYCFSMILLGMLSSGVACYAAGRGTLSFDQPKSSNGSPRGDGVLHSGDKFVVLMGAEQSVCAVTRGWFSLKFDHQPLEKSGQSGQLEHHHQQHQQHQHHRMGFSSLLLVVQFLLQLLLIPQGTLFGQIMFLATFVCSWVYNCYLSSIDKEEVQRGMLMSKVLEIGKPGLKKYTFAKRTTAVVFLLLILQPQDNEGILNELLPNNTKIWKIWKEQVLKRLSAGKGFESLPND
ncbi:hypothetical protein FS842_008407, partial [Serendipita sp. 407]